MSLSFTIFLGLDSPTWSACSAENALGPEGSGLRTLPEGNGVLCCEAERVCDDEPALRVEAKDASTLAAGGRGEVACTRARAAGVATIESAASAARGKLSSMRRCCSVSLAGRYVRWTILRGGLDGPASGASVSASLRFLVIFAALTLTIGRAGSGVVDGAADGAAEGSRTLGRFSTEMLSPRSSSGTKRGVGAAGAGRGLGATDTGRDGATADGVDRHEATTGLGRGDATTALGRGLATAIEGARDAGVGDDSAALKFEDVPEREILIFFLSGCFSFSCASWGAITVGTGSGIGAGTGGTAASKGSASAASSLGSTSSRFLLRPVLWVFVKLRIRDCFVLAKFQSINCTKQPGTYSTRFARTS